VAVHISHTRKGQELHSRTSPPSAAMGTRPARTIRVHVQQPPLLKRYEVHICEAARSS